MQHLVENSSHVDSAVFRLVQLLSGKHFLPIVGCCLPWQREASSVLHPQPRLLDVLSTRLQFFSAMADVFEKIRHRVLRHRRKKNRDKSKRVRFFLALLLNDSPLVLHMEKSAIQHRAAIFFTVTLIQSGNMKTRRSKNAVSL